MSRTFAAQLRPSTLPVSFVRKSAAALLLISLFSNTVPVFAVPVLSGSFGSSGQKRMTPVLNFDRTPEPFVIGQKASLSFSERILGTFTGMFFALRGKAEEVRDHDEAASETESGNAEISAPPQPAAVVDFDFDGDGKADPGRWNSAAASYRIRQSSNGSFVDRQIGSSSAKAAPGDFDGDGKTDAASFDAGTWTIKQSSNSQTVTFSFGQSGDIPMVGDFEGDGKDDAAVFRPSNSTWYVRESSTTNTVTTQFGQTGDVPVSGDFDGDGKADIAVYRPSTGYWWVQQSRDGLLSLQWGASTDVAVPADFDGDGKTDPAVFRPSTGTWYVLKSDGNYANNIIQGWGNYADQPVPADYDDDGKADFAIWRPSTGVWHIRKSYDSSTANYGVGVAGDVAVASAYVKQVGGSLAPYELAKERLKPRNATGGTDLYSQNFAWGRSLVGLSGRAGLDVGLGLSYNSLVWTKENDTLYFDTNVDNVSPGFRLGFPTIEPAYFVPGGIANDPYWAYVMVTPSGGRVEFKQNGVTKYFETTDSSYLQLEADAAPDPNIPVDDINLTLRGTDGSVLKFVWAGGAFRCSEIKDRNGNYIEIEHDELGLLRTITDTLGREIDVNYDSELFPTSISQSWKTSNGTGSATTHNWAEFEYTTIYPNTDFASGLAVAGPPNGWPVKVLHRVIYPDDSFTVFHYNDYAQVWKVENFAADDTLLNHVRVNLGTNPADQDKLEANQVDVPRFSKVWNWVQNFNAGNETEVTFTRTPNSSFSLPGSISGTGLLIEAEMDNDPFASVTRTWIGETGWQEGLPLASEDHAKPVEGGTVALQRWSWTDWTQDDVNASEQMNPRVVETRIGDDANTKRTTVEYLEYENTDTAIFGLVSKVKVYDHTGTSVIKEQRTDYNLSSTYLDRRIIGLPSKTQTYGWNDITQTLELASELTYAFDGEDFSFEANQVISPIRHDTANFGSSFVAGRGNLTSVTRHDVTLQTAAVTTKTRYDIAGSVVSRLDPLNRKVRFEYSDAFNDDVNRNSFAYPTKVYDPANNFSEAKYRFDIGANVWARSPTPAGQTVGKTTLRVFDSIGRLEKETIDNSGAYTRYAYPTNGVQSQVYTTIVDTNNNNTGDTADEVLSETWTDGAGRVRRSRTEHPGSVGGWVGSIVEYDILGRTKRSSVPTEISVPNVNNPDSWVPAGDDDRGLDGNGNPIWLWTHQRYDWMGRVVRKIATDGDPNAGSNDSDVLTSYAGCGCAGGLVTTIEGELVPRTDGTSGNARRKQKVYQDILGRTYKTETYEWDGSTVYSTSTAKFNGRDQVILGRQYAGDTSSTTFQDTTATFDGHGRLRSQHVPQQDANTYTAFEYYPDDRLHTKTDARGAISTMTYDDRGLLTEISSVLPGDPQTPTQRKNFALARNGAIPTASSENSTAFSRWAAINGDRTGGSWGNSGGWNDGTLNSYPDWLQVEFAESKTIDEINVITLQDNYQTAGEPTENTTFTQEGITSFDVQYWNGSSWTTVPNGNVTNNDKVWRKFEFSSVTTSKIRVVVNGSLNSYSRIVELEAWGPGSSPSVNTGAEFAYDAAGNRISMTDIYGSTTYEYNELSQMTAETRQFTDTLTHAPLPNNSFRLEYEYQLAGALRSLTDPYGDAIYYGNDRAGRLTSVTGSTFGNVTEYASDPGYRAWGGLQSLSYGNGVDMSMTFDDRLRPDFYELKKNSTELIKKSYEYIPDGNLKYVGDLLDGKFDRLQTYDHQGRIKAGKSGAEARGQTVDPGQMETQLPYRQSYEFNQFGNMTARNNLHWGREAWYGQNFNLSYTYQNNRITNQDWQYDADGRVKQSAAPDEWGTFTYDARGLLIRSHAGVNIVDIGRFYDGDGREVKRERTVFVEDEINYPNWPFGYWQVDGPTYYIRSTVLGGEIVSETGPTGKKKKTYVFAAGTKLATQAEYTYNSTTTESVYWHHADASGMSHRTSFTNGTVSHGAGNYDGAPAETDPLGGNMGVATPYIELTQPMEPGPEFPAFQLHGDDTMYVNGQRVPCTLDGMTIGCSTAMSMLGHSADIDFRNTDPRVLSQVGIFAYPTFGTRTIDNAPGSLPPDGGVGTDANPIRIHTTTTTERYFTGWGYLISWTPHRQTQSLEEKLIKVFIETVGDLFNDCLRTMVSRYVSAIKSTAQRKKESERLNALKPFDLNKLTVDLSMTAQEIIDKYKPGGVGVPVITDPRTLGGVPDSARMAIVLPKDGPNVAQGILLSEIIGADGKPVKGATVGNMLIAHEAGNLAAWYLFRGDWYALKDPRTQDPDSGAAMEMCIGSKLGIHPVKEF